MRPERNHDVRGRTACNSACSSPRQAAISCRFGVAPLGAESTSIGQVDFITRQRYRSEQLIEKAARSTPEKGSPVSISRLPRRIGHKTRSQPPGCPSRVPQRS